MSAATVYVTGLPSAATQEDVMDFFTRIGNVVEIKMPAADSAAPVAVVFDKAEDAVSAVSISGSDFQDDVPIQISAHQPGAEPEKAAPSAAADSAAAAAATGEAANAEEDGSAQGKPAVSMVGERRNLRPRDAPRADPRDRTNKVMVGNVCHAISRKDLHDAFAACGEINDFAVLPGRHIAFIGFATAEAYEKALKMEGTIINGIRIEVSKRVPFEDNASKSDAGRGATIANRIVVRGVPRTVSKEGLRTFFADCGAPTDIYVKPELGIAFVAFATAAEADKAIAKSGQEYEGSPVQAEHRQVLVCHQCKREGHVQAKCPEARGGDHGRSRGHRGRGGDRRRRRSSSSSSDRDRHHRRHRSDSLDRDRRRRRHSRSRSPPRRRRHSRSRSPPRSRR